MCSITSGAHRWRNCFNAALVAEKFWRFGVINKRYVAIFTLFNEAAVAAKKARGKPLAVYKKESTFLFIGPVRGTLRASNGASGNFCKKFLQMPAYNWFVAAHEFLAHINDLACRMVFCGSWQNKLSFRQFQYREAGFNSHSCAGVSRKIKGRLPCVHMRVFVILYIRPLFSLFF